MATNITNIDTIQHTETKENQDQYRDMNNTAMATIITNIDTIQHTETKENPDQFRDMNPEMAPNLDTNENSDWQAQEPGDTMPRFKICRRISPSKVNALGGEITQDLGYPSQGRFSRQERRFSQDGAFRSDIGMNPNSAMPNQGRICLREMRPNQDGAFQNDIGMPPNSAMPNERRICLRERRLSQDGRFMPESYPPQEIPNAPERRFNENVGVSQQNFFRQGRSCPNMGRCSKNVPQYQEMAPQDTMYAKNARYGQDNENLPQYQERIPQDTMYAKNSRYGQNPFPNQEIYPYNNEYPPQDMIFPQERRFSGSGILPPNSTYLQPKNVQSLANGSIQSFRDISSASSDNSTNTILYLGIGFVGFWFLAVICVTVTGYSFILSPLYCFTWPLQSVPQDEDMEDETPPVPVVKERETHRFEREKPDGDGDNEDNKIIERHEVVKERVGSYERNGGFDSERSNGRGGGNGRNGREREQYDRDDRY